MSFLFVGVGISQGVSVWSVAVSNGELNERSTIYLRNNCTPAMRNLFRVSAERREMIKKNNICCKVEKVTIARIMINKLESINGILFVLSINWKWPGKHILDYGSSQSIQDNPLFAEDLFACNQKVGEWIKEWMNK